MKKLFLSIIGGFFILQAIYAQEEKLTLSNLLIENTSSYFPIGLEMELKEGEVPYLLQFTVNMPEVVLQIEFSLGTSINDPASILTESGSIVLAEGEFAFFFNDKNYKLEKIPAPPDIGGDLHLLTIPLKLTKEQVSAWKYARVYVTDKKGNIEISHKDLN